MKEPLSNKLIVIALVVLFCMIVLGWAVQLSLVILQRMLPKSAMKIDDILEKIAEPIGSIQKNAFYLALFLLLIRFLAGWFGWTTPLF